MTEDCLRLLACSFAVLIDRQLEDQLPGGKFHQPSQKILSETRNAPRHNMLTERYFAQLGRKLEQKPNISTVAMSGCILFLNNKTSNWLNNLNEDEKNTYMERARKERPQLQVLYRKKRKDIFRVKQEMMAAKKQEKEEKEKKAARNETLASKIAPHGGVWQTVTEMDSQLKQIDPSLKYDVLADQIRFRKNILGTRVDSALLQLSHSKRKLNSRELESNLRRVISNVDAPAESSPLLTTHLRVDGDRREMVKIAIKRRLDQHHLKQAAAQEKLSVKKIEKIS